MPNVVGQTYGNAQNLLQQAGVYIPSKIGYFGSFPISASWHKDLSAAGTVLGQSINPGTQVVPNAPITLLLSQYPMAVSFPTMPPLGPTPAQNIAGQITTDTGIGITTDYGAPITIDSATPPTPGAWTADSDVTADSPNFTADG